MININTPRYECQGKSFVFKKSQLSKLIKIEFEAPNKKGV